MNTSSILKRLAPHGIAIALFVLVSAVYFLPQFQGEVLMQDDIVQFKGMVHESLEIEEETGRWPLWTDAMFGGMPTYQVGLPPKGNFLQGVAKALRLWIPRPTGYFLLAMICAYILFISIGVKPFVALVGCIGYSITTYHLTIYDTGHTSKMLTLIYSPLIIAGVIETFREKWIKGGVLFSLGLGLNLMAGHYQMTYYLFIALLVMGIVELVRSARAGQMAHIGKSLGVFVVGGALAFGASASKLWTTYEYSKDTMRGEPILSSEGENVTSSSQVKGLEWTYAMNWSNGALDLFATVIPGVAGGSSGEKVGPGSDTYDAFKRGGVPMQREDNTYQAPLYWGDLPFTSGPSYVGVLFVFLFILGMFTVKAPLKWWIGISVLIVYLLSMGKNFEILSRLFFDYFPMYNKFRAPSSILGVSGLLIPVFGVYALSDILSRKPSWKDVRRPFYIALGTVGTICLFFGLLGPSVFDFSAPADAQYQNTGLVDLFIADRKSLMRSDAWRCLFIVLIGAGAIWAYLNDKLKYTYALLIISLVAIFDLWSVGRRYLNWSDFEDNNAIEAYYQPRPVDTQIMGRESNRGAYRVLDLSVNTFNSSRTSYFHNTIGGYHAAKLQRYQDLIDRHISQNNPAVINMLNTRYVINQNGQLNINSEALGNAWFVGGVNFVETAAEEIAALNDINPANSVVVHTDFRDQISVANAPQGGSITLEDYVPDHLTYKSNTSAEQIAVFSEIWYGPDKGWQAYVDGEPVPHFRANYALRGMVVPSGQHTIEFVFKPRTYSIGKIISTISSILIILLTLAAVYFVGRSQLAEPAQPKTKNTSAATAKKKRKPR